MQGNGEINALFSGIKGAQTPPGGLNACSKISGTVPFVKPFPLCHAKGSIKHTQFHFLEALCNLLSGVMECSIGVESISRSTIMSPNIKSVNSYS